jgi:hypothetical protein
MPLISSLARVMVTTLKSQSRPDFGGNRREVGKNLGEVQQPSSRPPWKVRV